jgi:hypothetical protein
VILATLGEIKSEIDRRAALIGASGYVLPTYGRSEDFARPHIEVDNRGYHYVVVERGSELQRVTSPDLEEILYHVFQAVTFSLACAYEAKRRISGQDARRQLFERQVELLGKLSPEWAASRSEEHRQILQAHPFLDR